MTSSPSLKSHKSAAISRAWVQEVVSRHLAVPVIFSRYSLHFLVKIPSPQMCILSTASFTYSISRPVKGGTLNRIISYLHFLLPYLRHSNSTSHRTKGPVKTHQFYSYTTKASFTNTCRYPLALINASMAPSFLSCLHSAPSVPHQSIAS